LFVSMKIRDNTSNEIEGNIDDDSDGENIHAFDL
jgi:hypothetical protein